MALEALLAKLDADARQERASLLAEAEDQATKLRQETESHLARRRARALEEVRAEAAAAVRSRTAQARAEARRMVLEARRALLDRLRTATEARIADGAGTREYREALPDEVTAALARAPEGPLALLAPPVLADALRDALEAATDDEERRRIDMVPDEGMDTGFVLAGEEGRVLVDATLAARLERVWASEAQRVLRELDR